MITTTQQETAAQLALLVTQTANAIVGVLGTAHMMAAEREAAWAIHAAAENGQPGRPTDVIMVLIAQRRIAALPVAGQDDAGGGS